MVMKNKVISFENFCINPRRSKIPISSLFSRVQGASNLVNDWLVVLFCVRPNRSVGDLKAKRSYRSNRGLIVNSTATFPRST